jgi:hypothetical protein
MKQCSTAGYVRFPNHNVAKRKDRKDPLPDICYGSDLLVSATPTNYGDELGKEADLHIYMAVIG